MRNVFIIGAVCAVLFLQNLTWASADDDRKAVAALDTQ